MWVCKCVFKMSCCSDGVKSNWILILFESWHWVCSNNQPPLADFKMWWNWNSLLGHACIYHKYLKLERPSELQGWGVLAFKSTWFYAIILSRPIVSIIRGIFIRDFVIINSLKFHWYQWNYSEFEKVLLI